MWCSGSLSSRIKKSTLVYAYSSSKTLHSKSQTLRFGDNKNRSEDKDKRETIKMEFGKKQKGKRNRKHELETEFCRLFVVISLKASSIGLFSIFNSHNTNPVWKWKTRDENLPRRWFSSIPVLAHGFSSFPSLFLLLFLYFSFSFSIYIYFQYKFASKSIVCKGNWLWACNKVYTVCVYFNIYLYCFLQFLFPVF